MTTSIARTAPAARILGGVDLLARAAAGLALATVAACLLLGTLAAAIGGSLAGLGAGFGGGNGFPALLLFAATVLAVPSLVAGVLGTVTGAPHGLARVGVFAGALAFLLGYVLVSHTFDPCANGWVDAASGTLAGAPLCGYWGGGAEIAARFHLLTHALGGGLAAVAYGLVLRRWHPAFSGRPGRAARAAKRARTP